MVSRGTAKPYVHFLGNSSVDVTGSCHLVRFRKYALLLDCGLIQQGDIATAYKLNRAQLKKISATQIDYICLSHVHIDHSGIIPALYAKGCQAHVYVPFGSIPFLRLLWQDSLKIMQADCEKLTKKHGLKASPFYSEKDIAIALDRCIEVKMNETIQIADGIKLIMYSAGHIINAAQILLELQEGSVIKRIGYTGDIGGTTPRPYVLPRDTLPFCDLLIGESTYNTPSRINKAYDRAKDIEKIEAVVRDSNRVLFPCFSLGRTQELLTVLYDMWQHQDLPLNIPIYLDSPLAIKFCNLWQDSPLWEAIMNWSNLHFVRDYNESLPLQMSDSRCIILAASGFLNGGRIVSHLKTTLPNLHNHIMFCGYSGQNNLASQIRFGQKEVNVDGSLVANRANITELVSFSSHANYEELVDYYSMCRFNKLALVHGEYEGKVNFVTTLKEKFYQEAKACKVVCVNDGTKISL